MKLRPGRKLRVLDFDCEARPLSWYAGDLNTKEITAIAAQYTDTKLCRVWLLGQADPIDMLQGFRKLYDKADIVTGHYIRKFDLPLINAAMVEYAMPPLSPKLAQDTCLDIVKRHGMSNSQENIAAMLGTLRPKVHMTQEDWRQANRLTDRGLRATRKRVVGDVRQHIEMRQAMLDRGILKPPRTWFP